MKTRLSALLATMRLTGLLLTLLPPVSIYGQAQWIEQGPGPIGPFSDSDFGISNTSGRVMFIAPDPSNSNRVFVAADNGGVWRTDNATDASPTWFPKTDQFPSIAMRGIAFSPLDTTHNTLFASSRGGILKTIDGGDSWVLLGTSTFISQDVQRIAPTPVVGSSGQTVLAVAANPFNPYPTTGGGVYRSLDGGLSWEKRSGSNGQPANGLPDSSFTALVEDPGNSQRLFVAIDSPPQLFRSENMGDTWADLTSSVGLPCCQYNPIKLAFSPSADGRGIHWIYLISQGVGIFFSTNSGSAWMKMDPPPSGGEFTAYIAVSPNDANVVFSLNTNTERWRGNASAASGSQWQLLNVGGTSPHTDGKDWVFSASPNLIYECDDGGIFRLRNPFSNSPRWESAVGNLRVTEFYTIAYDTVSHVIFGGAQDESTPHQTTPGGIAWKQLENGYLDGLEAAVDNTSTPDASVHYNCVQTLGFPKRRTYTSPTAFSETPMSLIINNTGGRQISHDFDGTTDFYNRWEVNASDGRRLLVGTDYLYESFDRGDHFASLGGIGQNGTGDPIPLNPVGHVTAYAYGHSQDPNVFYVGTRGNNPGGANLWMRASGTGYPTAVTSYKTAGGSTPNDIAFDPNDKQRVYVVDDNGRVWRTTNGGAGWTDVTGNLGGLIAAPRGYDGVILPFLPMPIEVISPSSVPGDVTVLVGGVGGVCYTRDTPSGGAVTWSKLGVLPNTFVSDLHYYAADDVLICGTHGRGAWKMSDVRRWLFGGCFTSERCDPTVTWVDFNWPGTETGCSDQPYNTLAEGIAHVNGQTLAIKSGTTSATGTISTPMTIEACGGSVTIGRQP